MEGPPVTALTHGDGAVAIDEQGSLRRQLL
jgi:hypothetical protein